MKRTALKPRSKPLKRTAPRRGKPPKRSRIVRKRPRDWEDWVAARDAYAAAHPNCEVPVCRRATEVIHHRENRGTGYRDHGALMALCVAHHTGDEGVHTLGKLTWRARFWGEEESRE